jgi:hypothetical protein
MQFLKDGNDPDDIVMNIRLLMSRGRTRRQAALIAEEHAKQTAKAVKKKKQGSKKNVSKQDT